MHADTHTKDTCLFYKHVQGKCECQGFLRLGPTQIQHVPLITQPHARRHTHIYIYILDVSCMQLQTIERDLLHMDTCSIFQKWLIIRMITLTFFPFTEHTITQTHKQHFWENSLTSRSTIFCNSMVLHTFPQYAVYRAQPQFDLIIFLKLVSDTNLAALMVEMVDVLLPPCRRGLLSCLSNSPAPFLLMLVVPPWWTSF